MLSFSRSISTPVLALAALAAGGACTEPAPVAPADAEPFTAVAAARNFRLRIANVALDGSTLVIGGAEVGYDATVENATNRTATGVLVQGYIVQGAVEAGAGGTSVDCVAASPGVLPPGSCTFRYKTSASNATVSGGVLAPGPATFQLRLYQADKGKTTLLHSYSVSVLLSNGGEPYIVRQSLDSLQSPRPLSFEWTVDYNIVIENPTGITLTGTDVETEYLQVRDGITYGAGGGSGPVECSPGVFDQLTPGTCTMPFSTTPHADPNGLQEGSATLYIRLYVNDVLKSTQTVPVYLSFPQT